MRPNFILRRFVFALITTPVVVATYAFVFAGFAMLTNDYSISHETIYRNLIEVALGYVLAMPFIPYVWRALGL